MEQLQEALLHAGTYSGRDAMEQSFRVAHTVLGQLAQFPAAG
jgi:hypothetical protein